MHARVCPMHGKFRLQHACDPRMHAKDPLPQERHPCMPAAVFSRDANDRRMDADVSWMHATDPCMHPEEFCRDAENHVQDDPVSWPDATDARTPATTRCLRFVFSRMRQQENGNDDFSFRTAPSAATPGASFSFLGKPLRSMHTPAFPVATDGSFVISEVADRQGMARIVMKSGETASYGSLATHPVAITENIFPRGRRSLRRRPTRPRRSGAGSLSGQLQLFLDALARVAHPSVPGADSGYCRASGNRNAPHPAPVHGTLTRSPATTIGSVRQYSRSFLKVSRQPMFAAFTRLSIRASSCRVQSLR